MLTSLESEEALARILEFLGPSGILVCEAVSRAFRDRIRTPTIAHRLSRLVNSVRPPADWKLGFRHRISIRSDRLPNFVRTSFIEPTPTIPTGAYRLGCVLAPGCETRDLVLMVGDYFVTMRPTSFSLIDSNGIFIGTYPMEFQRILNSPLDPGQSKLLCARLDRSISFFSPDLIVKNFCPGTVPTPVKISSNIDNIIPRYVRCFWGEKLLVVSPLYAAVYRIAQGEGDQYQCSCLWSHRHDGSAFSSEFQLRKHFIMEMNSTIAVGNIAIKVYSAHDGSLRWLQYCDTVCLPVDLRMSSSGLVYDWYESTIWYIDPETGEHGDLWFNGEAVYPNPMMSYPYCKTTFCCESVVISSAASNKHALIGVADFVSNEAWLYEVNRSPVPRLVVLYRQEPLGPVSISLINIHPDRKSFKRSL